MEKRLVTRYALRSAAAANENQRRVEAVFDELAAAKPDKVSNIVLRLADDSGLRQILEERVDAVAKDLEVYSGDQPPPDFSLDLEVEGILRVADVHGFDRFHLVGYSGGGASSLAFAARHGDRLLSLALLEPAWAGNDRTPAEEALMQRFRALEPLPADQFMAGFVQLQLAPGVAPPQP